MHCPNCGTETDAKYCPNCGTKIESDECIQFNEVETEEINDDVNEELTEDEEKSETEINEKQIKPQLTFDSTYQSYYSENSQNGFEKRADTPIDDMSSTYSMNGTVHNSHEKEEHSNRSRIIVIVCLVVAILAIIAFFWRMYVLKSWIFGDAYYSTDFYEDEIDYSAPIDVIEQDPVKPQEKDIDHYPEPNEDPSNTGVTEDPTEPTPFPTPLPATDSNDTDPAEDQGSIENPVSVYEPWNDMAHGESFTGSLPQSVYEYVKGAYGDDTISVEIISPFELKYVSQGGDDQTLKILSSANRKETLFIFVSDIRTLTQKIYTIDYSDNPNDLELNICADGSSIDEYECILTLKKNN